MVSLESLTSNTTVAVTVFCFVAHHAPSPSKSIAVQYEPRKSLPRLTEDFVISCAVYSTGLTRFTPFRSIVPTHKHIRFPKFLRGFKFSRRHRISHVKMAGNLNLTGGMLVGRMPPGMMPSSSVPDVSSADFMSSAPVKTEYVSEKHHRDMLECLLGLKKNHELCDVSIIVNDRQIYAHRAVLAACRYVQLTETHYHLLKLHC